MFGRAPINDTKEHYDTMTKFSQQAAQGMLDAERQRRNDQAWRELIRFRDAYANMEEFQPVFDLVAEYERMRDTAL